MPAASIQSISPAADEEDAAAGLDDESFEPLCVRLEILHELEEAPLEIAIRLTLEILPGAYERFVEALAVERLQQVVERVDVEGAQRVVIERRHKHDERHARRTDGLDDLETARAGHLDVEEDQVRLQPPDGIDRLGPGGALGDDLQPVFRREERAQPLASKGLVIGDEDAHLAVRHATWNAASLGGVGAWWKGNSSRTARPLVSSENSIRCAAP